MKKEINNWKKEQIINRKNEKKINNWNKNKMNNWKKEKEIIEKQGGSRTARLAYFGDSVGELVGKDG